MAADLIVLIATSGRAELLHRTLASLAQCQLPAEFREVVVIENGPKGNAQSVIENSALKIPIRYLYEAKGNKSGALNRIIEQIDNELVFFTDDDVRFDQRTLGAVSEAAATSGPKTYFGGPIQVDYEVAPPDWLREFLPWCAIGCNREDNPRAFQHDTFFGCNWAAFAQDIRAVGGFDTSRGPGAQSRGVGQETEMQLRLQRHGFKGIYVPESLVWHYVPASRCSPEWALDRAYRRGVRKGLDTPPDARRLFGYPRYALGEAVRKTFWHWIARLSPDERTRFRALRDKQVAFGRLRGFNESKLKDRTLRGSTIHGSGVSP